MLLANFKNTDSPVGAFATFGELSINRGLAAMSPERFKGNRREATLRPRPGASITGIFPFSVGEPVATRTCRVVLVL